MLTSTHNPQLITYNKDNVKAVPKSKIITKTIASANSADEVDTIAYSGI